MSLRLLPGVLLALMLLQACDGTPFGQRLSDSFDDPTAQPSSEDAAQSVQVKPEPVEEAPVETDSVKKDSVEKDSAKAEPVDTKPVDTKAVEIKADLPRAMTGRTLPYRITIRLSSADPAAPAEGVTEALRKAGIGFEVETIEKISTAQSAKPMEEQSTPSP